MANEASDTRRRSSLVQEIYGEMAQQIQQQTLVSGTLLPPERALSEQYGVSRTVMREAIKQLESQGMLEVRHGIGNRVVNNLHKPLNQSLSLLLPDARERLQSLTEARLLIEPEVARRAAARATPKQIAELKTLQETLAQAPDTARAVECDMEFHRCLARVAGNPVLALMLETIADLGRQSRLITISRYGAPRAHQQHRTILAAIERGDARAAGAAMQRHLRITEAELEAQFEGA